MTTPQLATLIILIILGWVCTRSPAIVARFSTLHVRETGREKSREVARLVRTDPEEWQRRFPEQVNIIRIAGFIAYFIAFAGFAIWLLSLLSGG
jgi:hypothetical protein